MVWRWTPYLIPLMIAAVVLFAAALYVLWRRRPEGRSISAAVLLLAGAVWMTGYLLELASADPGAGLMWDRVKYIGIVIIPAAWFVYTLQSTGRGRWLSPVVLALLSIVPLMILLLVVTNDSHGLMWRAEPVTSSVLVTANKTWGVGFWVFLAYAYVLFFAGSFLLIHTLVRARRLYRWQALALLFAALTAWLGSLLNVSGLNPFSRFDATLLVLALSGPAAAWGIYGLRLGDIIPVTREVVIENMGDSVIVLDAEDRIVDLNPAAQQLLGHARLQAIGEPVGRVWPEWDTLVEHSFPGAEASREMVLAKRDQQRTYDLRVSPLTDRRGRLTSQVVVLRDITELKQRTEELATVLEAIKAVSSTLDLEEVLVVIAREMVKAGAVDGCTISRWDQETDSVIRWIEWRHQAPRGADQAGSAYVLEDFPTYRTVLESRRAVAVHASDPQADPDEVALMREKAGASMLVLPLAVGDRVVGLVELDTEEQERHFTTAEVRLCQALADQAAVAIESAQLYTDLQHQMEQLKSTQAQLIQSAKLAAVGELAAGVAHELNNPLTIILGFAELVADEMGPDSPERQCLEKIHSETQRARDIVHDLLDFARQRGPDRHPADIGQIIRETVAVMRYQLEKSAIVIEELYAAGLRHLSVDEARMKQVFVNLISNALRAMPNGGTLAVRTARIGDEVAVSISDTGTGIAPENLKRIFDPFFTTNPAGTGLGLSVSLAIVQAHMGRITVESHVGQGSTFTVWLPIQQTGVDSGN